MSHTNFSYQYYFANSKKKCEKKTHERKKEMMKTNKTNEMERKRMRKTFNSCLFDESVAHETCITRSKVNEANGNISENVNKENSIQKKKEKKRKKI